MITLIVTIFRIIKEVFKTIYKFALFIVICGSLTAGLDYTRMSSGQNPIFSLKNYNPKTRIQYYYGLFYKGSRKIRASENEPLTESSKIKYKLVYKYNIKIPTQYKEVPVDYVVETEETKDCVEQSKLYYADENVKIYTYCLESFKVKNENKSEELIDYIKKDVSIIDEVDSKLGYTGLYLDRTTQMYLSRDDGSTNNGLAMFKCNNNGVTDIYFGPREMSFQPDFCTLKDDDFNFMYKIEEVEHEKIEGVETFYEDTENYYQFDETKSDFIVLKTPAVRGKQELQIPLKVALYNKYVTIDELKEKGLQFNVVSKTTTNNQ